MLRIIFLLFLSFSSFAGFLEVEYIGTVGVDPDVALVSKRSMAQKACIDAFTKLDDDHQVLNREDIKVADHPLNSIMINFRKDSVEGDYLPNLNSVRLLITYHYRGDGRRPIYKQEAFTSAWIEDRYKKTVKTEEDLQWINIITMSSVLDQNGKVDLYVISREKALLHYHSWIIKALFDLFESDQDKMEDELCMLLQRIHLPNVSRRVAEERKEKIERALLDE